MTLSYLLLKMFLHLTLSIFSTDSQLPNDCTPIPTEFVNTEEDVYYKLSAISSSKAADPDDIPNWILKSYAHVLRLPVTSIFNASFQQASVPTTRKRAEIIPVPKIKSSQ